MWPAHRRQHQSQTGMWPVLGREPRVPRMFHAKRAGTPRELHLGTQSCEDVPSSETGQITSSQGISKPRVPRTSHAKRARTLRTPHLGTQSCEDVSGETGQVIPSQEISEARIPRMSPAKRAGHFEDRILDPRVVRMSKTKRARSPQVKA